VNSHIDIPKILYILFYIIKNKESEKIPYEVEIKRSIYEKLEQVADLEDETISSIVEMILSEWLEENFEAMLEGRDETEEEEGSEDNESTDE